MRRINLLEPRQGLLVALRTCARLWDFSKISPLSAAHGAVAAAALLATSSVFAEPNLIVNGDFSDHPPFQNGTWGAWDSIPGWTSKFDLIEIGTNETYGMPPVGSGVNLEVDANMFGHDYQDVGGLTPGGWYTLSYLYGGRPPGSGWALDVYFGGAKLTTNTGSIGFWTANTFVVQATAATERLEFISQHVGGGGSPGNEIANVSLTALHAVPVRDSSWGRIKALYH